MPDNDTPLATQYEIVLTVREEMLRSELAEMAGLFDLQVEVDGDKILATGTEGSVRAFQLHLQTSIDLEALLTQAAFGPPSEA